MAVLKKKKSFRQKMKKIGRRGGNDMDGLDKSTYDYFLGILDAISQMDRAGDMERGSFADNVLDETVGREGMLCRHQLASRVIESLLSHASPKTFQRFRDVLSEDLRRNSTDIFASHVLEKMLQIASDDTKEDTEDKKWVQKVSKFAINNLSDFIFDPYASHLLRTAILSLTRVRDVPKELGLSKKSPSTKDISDANQSAINVPNVDEEVLDVVELAVSRILEYSDFKEILGQDTSSAMLQILIFVLYKLSNQKKQSTQDSLQKKSVKLFRKLCKHVLSVVHDDFKILEDLKSSSSSQMMDVDQEDLKETEEDPLPDFINYQPVCRTLECMIWCCCSSSCDDLKSDTKIWTEIVEKILKKEFLIPFACHMYGNHVIQKALTHIQDVDLFNEWYGDVFDGQLITIYESGNHGVLQSIAETCQRLQTKQNHFIVALTKLFGCNEMSKQNQLIPSIVSMKRLSETGSNETEEPTQSVNIYGSKIVQALLAYNKPIKIVNSILQGFNSEKLSEILCDPKGSYITDAFMVNAKFVGEKSKDSFIKLLKNELHTMACTKHGSRSIDAIWEGASKGNNTKLKQFIASSLVNSAVDNLSTLNANTHGKFVVSKLHLSVFKRNPDQWKRDLEGLCGDSLKRQKTLSMFKDIIMNVDDGNDSVKKAKIANDDVHIHKLDESETLLRDRVQDGMGPSYDDDRETFVDNSYLDEL